MKRTQRLHHPHPKNVTKLALSEQAFFLLSGPSCRDNLKKTVQVNTFFISLCMKHHFYGMRPVFKILLISWTSDDW